MDKNESTPQLTVGRTLMTHNWPVLMWETVVSTSEGEPFAVAVQGTEEASRRLAEHIVRSVAGGEPPHDLRNCPAMRELERLTPGGSEFVDDIPRCVQHVRDSQRSVMKALVSAKKQARAGGEPEQKVAVAEFVLQCLQSGCTADEILAAIREGKDVPAPPQGKEQK